MAMIKPHWKFSRYLEGYGDLAEPLKRRDSHFLELEGSHSGGSICTLFHRRRCTGSQSGKTGANFGVYALDAHFVILPTSIWSPTSCGRLAKCRALVKRPTFVQRWGHTCMVVGESLILQLFQILVQPFWRGITPEYSSPCKPHIGTCLQFTAAPTQGRVRQACLPKNFASRKLSSRWCLREKRMKSKTKPHQETRSSSSARPKIGNQPRKVIARHDLATWWFLSLLGFQQQEHKPRHWGKVSRNSCRQRKSALLRRTAKPSMSVLDLVVEQQG